MIDGQARRGLVGIGLLIAAFGAALPARAQGTADVFAGEPSRPRAPTPVAFSTSWDEARAEARRTGKRLLAYFTGAHCGWCRALEKRTFPDAEVVAASRSFVCVEIRTDEERNARLVDEFRVDTIPRSYVLTPGGRVIDRRTGYLPAAEYAAWLKGVGTRPPADATPAAGPRPPAPAPAGDPEATADVAIWFVDANRGIARWSDEDWTGHAHLIRLLRAAGLRPMVEHMAREDFPARWDRAESKGRLPGLIAANSWGGLLLDLFKKGRLIHVQSDRLAWMPETASCADFRGLSMLLVPGAAYAPASRRALEVLLAPGPENALPGADLAEAVGRDEAARVASAAVAAYFSGDAPALAAVASPASRQLARCTRPEPVRQGMAVETGAVELRGNGAIAFARVEMRFRGPSLMGADPVAVALRREGTAWKTLSLSNDVFWLRALPGLCQLRLGTPAGANAPPTPRLLRPDDDAPIGRDGRSFTWEVPPGVEPIAAQVCEVLLDVSGSSWPMSRIEVFPGEPRAQSAPLGDSALTGLISDEMRWCVWAIGADGRTSVSEVRRYRRASPRG